MPDDGVGDTLGAAGLRFFRAPPEDERIAALEPHDREPRVCPLQHQFLHLRLRERVLAGALARVAKLSTAPGVGQDFWSDQGVIEDHICLGQRLRGGERQQPGVSRAGADNRHVSRPAQNADSSSSGARMVSGSIPSATYQSRVLRTGEISDGLIPLRPPQNTFVYETTIPASARCMSMAALWANTRALSVPCATPITFTLLNSGRPRASRHAS